MTSSWDGLELRHLTALRALDTHGSFSAAADALGVTQSAVSQQIAKLEAMVGQRLVDRPGGQRGVTFNPAGQALLRHASAIADQLARAEADLEALAAGTAGTLRVGCFQSAGVRILPRVLREFSDAYPDVEVQLVEAEDDGQLLRMVEQGTLDLTFVVYPMPTGPFAAVTLLEDPYVVVVREDSALASTSEPMQSEELLRLPLVTYARMREVHAIENRLGRPELTEQIVFRSNDNGTILGLAAEGVGVAVVSWLSVDPYREGVRARVLAGVSPRVVGIAWHGERESRPVVERFTRIAQAVAQEEQTKIPAHPSRKP